jgi:hypothetical protein
MTTKMTSEILLPMAAAKERMKLKFGLACEAAVELHDMLFELNHLLFDKDQEEQDDHFDAIRDANGPIASMMRKWADYIDTFNELFDEYDDI